MIIIANLCKNNVISIKIYHFNKIKKKKKKKKEGMKFLVPLALLNLKTIIALASHVRGNVICAPS